jgi:hypothetical protein
LSDRSGATEGLEGVAAAEFEDARPTAVVFEDAPPAAIVMGGESTAKRPMIKAYSSN